ncbi:hypothetical protein BGX26_009326 [Mortierella sp. AD094]|nr:hypothetical protein BGX26_009326 [Mortierella sp. AD094]
MSQQATTDKRVSEMLIVGAGIGGLALAILLDQINIPHHIFERASEVKPLGSAMAFTGVIFPALEQLGIHVELMEVSKPYTEVEFYNATLKKLGSFNVEYNVVASGYESLIFARPKFYEILRKRVPEHKISFKKKIINTEEKDGKVHIYCSDDTAYSGDILIGADGAYSGVRQSFYKKIDEEGVLPKSDLEDFAIGYITIVGVATPSNPEKYPQLKEEQSRFNQVLYGDSSNKFALSLGGTLGELFDATPKHLISKVFLEEKIFKTWHHGRTVLLEDACHKFHPAGAQGAVNAIFDAISLANCLFSMKDSSAENISASFEGYTGSVTIARRPGSGTVLQCPKF